MKLSNRQEKIKFLNDCLAGKRNYSELRPVRIRVYMYDSNGNVTLNGKPLTEKQLKRYQSSINSGKMITIKANKPLR
jgi:hypothetical protein